MSRMTPPLIVFACRHLLIPQPARPPSDASARAGALAGAAQPGDTTTPRRCRAVYFVNPDSPATRNEASTQPMIRWK